MEVEAKEAGYSVRALTSCEDEQQTLYFAEYFVQPHDSIIMA